MAGQDGPMPQRGVDYPGTWAEFVKWFSDDGACLEYLERLRWPEGFICPRCGLAWLAALRRSVAVCRLSSGDVGDGRHDPRRDTHAVAAVVRCGLVRVRHQERSERPRPAAASRARQLQRRLGRGCTSCAGPWSTPTASSSMAMSKSMRPTSAVQSLVCVGGRARGKKNLVAIGVECEGAGSGRVRLARIGDASSRSLHPFVRANIEPAAVLLTDAWQGYAGIDRAGYVHKPVSVRASVDDASELLPRLHRVASLLKRWLLGTHPGAVRPAHLDYLDEFTFRYNRRTSRSRGLLFYRLVQQATRTAPQPMKVIVGGSAGYRTALELVGRSG